MEQVIQRKKNHLIWINGLKDTTSEFELESEINSNSNVCKVCKNLFHAKVQNNMSV